MKHYFLKYLSVSATLEQLRYLVLILSLSILSLLFIWTSAVHFLNAEYRLMEYHQKVDTTIEKYLKNKKLDNLEQAKGTFHYDARLKALEEQKILGQQRQEAHIEIKQFFLPDIFLHDTVLSSLQFFLLPMMFSLLGACFYFMPKLARAQTWHSPYATPRYVNFYLLIALGLGALAGALMLKPFSANPPTSYSGSAMFLMALGLGFGTKTLVLKLKQYAIDYAQQLKQYIVSYWRWLMQLAHFRQP